MTGSSIVVQQSDLVALGYGHQPVDAGVGAGGSGSTQLTISGDTISAS